MSVGIIWYKTQPDGDLSVAIRDLLTDYCGNILSHNVTVQPLRIAQIISDVFLRCDNVIIVGGLECARDEDNMIFILSHVLGMKMETKFRSRSRFCYDKLRNIRLPSLAGSILFPTRAGSPEGVLLTSENQSIIVLPTLYRPAVTAAAAMREYLKPEIARRKTDAASKVIPEPVQKDYQKFSSNKKAAPVTRVYDENQLIDSMERALWRVRDHSSDDDSFDYMYDDRNRGSN